MHRGDRGTFPKFPEIGKSRGDPFFKGVWGETGFPKGLLGTIQSIWVAGNPIISNLETIPAQNHAFRGPIFGPKTSPGQPGPNFQIPGPNCGPEFQKLVPGTQNQKDAHRKTMQNPASRIPTGAIWCKLWSKNILINSGAHFPSKLAQRDGGSSKMTLQEF